ncbi:MAG: MDR family MFS transporter [Candidatus Thermoplasmatota archaeon]
MPVPPAATKKRSGNGLILTGLMLGVLLGALDQTIVGTSLPKIVSDLKDFEHLAALITAYLLASVVVIPVAGKFSDNYGRRPVYLFGMSVFLLGSVLCGLSGQWGDWHIGSLTVTGMYQLVLFRFIQGLGGGAIFPVAIATIGDLYAPAERGRVQGLFGAMFGLASVIGPFIGGWIVDNATFVSGIAPWRWVFYVNLPVGAAALFMVWTHFPRKSERHPHPIDWMGIATITTFLVSVIIVAEWGGDGEAAHAWGSTLIVGLILLALVCLALFVLIESRVKDPLIPLALFKEPIFTVSAVASIFLGAAMFGVISFMPTYMQGVVGISATYSGAAIIPLSFTMIAGSISSGRMMKRFGYKPFMVIGPLIAASGYGLLYELSIDTAPPVWQAILVMMYLGVGIGFTMQTFVVASQNAIERRFMGVGTSSITLFRTLGATLGIAAFGAILNRRLETQLPAHLSQAALERLLATPGVDGHIARIPQLLTTPQFMDAQFEGHDALVQGIKDGFGASIGAVWVAGAIAAALGWLIAVWIRAKPLKTAAEYDAPAPAAH